MIQITSAAALIRVMIMASKEPWDVFVTIGAHVGWEDSDALITLRPSLETYIYEQLIVDT